MGVFRGNEDQCLVEPSFLLSLASPPVTEASTWAFPIWVDRKFDFLEGTLKSSLEPWSISRSILSSWSNAFLKILTTQWTPLLHWDGPRPPTERAMYCSLYQAIAFKCPTPIWMIFPWSMSEKARASQRVTIAKWCFQVVQSRSRTKRRRRVVFVLSTLRLPLSINGDPPKGE